MKTFLIFGSLLVLVQGQYHNSPQNHLGYGPPPQPQGYQEYGPPQPINEGYGRPSYDEEPQDPQGYPSGPPSPPQEEEDTRPIRIVKHVFVHVAPDDQASGITRVIKAPIPRERQVNIVFVKAPAPAAPDHQIVDIPNDGGKKTLVYVLLKKNDAIPDPDFKLPGPTPASKPEVYFIRYKDQAKKDKKVPTAPQYGASAPEAPKYGAPSAPVPVAKAPQSQYSAPTTRYGAPVQEGQQPGGYHK